MAHRGFLRLVTVLAFVLSFAITQMAHAVTTEEGFFARAMVVSDLPDVIAERVWDGVRIPLEGVVKAYGLNLFSFQGKAVYSSMSLLLSRCRKTPEEPPPTSFVDRCVTENIMMRDLPYGAVIVLDGSPPRWDVEVRIYDLAGTAEPIIFSVHMEADGQPELTTGLKTVFDFACVEMARTGVRPQREAPLQPERGILLVVDPRSSVLEGTVLIDRKYEKAITLHQPVFLPSVTSAVVRRMGSDGSFQETDISVGPRAMIKVVNVRPIRPVRPVAAAPDLSTSSEHSGPSWWQSLLLTEKGGVALGGIGVAAAGVGTYLFLHGRSLLEESQDKSVPYRRAQELYRDGADQQGIGLPFMIAGGGLVALGAGMYFWDDMFGPTKGASSGEPPAGIIPTDDGAAFYARFRW